MSFRALLYAVRDQLRSAAPVGVNPPAAMNLAASDCEVMADERPAPRCGQRFVSIYRAGRSSIDQVSLDEYYNFNIAVTQRVNGPFDQWALNTLYDFNNTPSGKNGLDGFCDAIRAFVHKDSENYFISNLASQYLGNIPLNGVISGTPPLGFVEAIAFTGDEIPRIVGASHFHADPDSDQYGFCQILHFGKSRRKQSQDAMS